MNWRKYYLPTNNLVIFCDWLRQLSLDNRTSGNIYLCRTPSSLTQFDISLQKNAWKCARIKILYFFFIINNLGRIVSVMIKVLAKMSILTLDLFLSTTMQSIFLKKKPSYKHAWLEAVKQIIHWEQHKIQLIGCHCINTLKHANYWIKWLANIKLTIALIRGKDIYRRET